MLVLLVRTSRSSARATTTARCIPTIFDLRGVALAAWTLAAFAIGVLAGILIRRVIPAMFATLAVWAGLAFVTGAFLRGHYAGAAASPPTPTCPLRRLGDQPGVDPRRQAGQPGHDQPDARAVDVQAVTPGHVPTRARRRRPTCDPVQYLIQHGYTQLTTYQPASRFWPFQWIEGGWLLALSLLLIATTVWLVRRRAA